MNAIAKPLAPAVVILAAGDCELCGHWDGRLTAGVCDECRRRFGIQDALEIPDLEQPIGPASAAQSRSLT